MFLLANDYSYHLWNAYYMAGRVQRILYFHTIPPTNLPEKGILIFLVLK